MNKNLLITIGVVLAAAVGIWWFVSQSGMRSDDGAKAGYTVTMKEQDIDKQSGTAMIAEENGKAKVTIKIAAGAQDVPQPAHIHTGACPIPGAVAYPLSDVVNGESETTLDVSVAELSGQMPLAVNVHKSADNATAYVSCGDIK